MFALYDHAFAWSPSTSYVALTRQTERVTLHVPVELAADRAALIRQMGRARRLATSLDFAVRDELAPVLRETPERAWERIKADYRSLHDAAGGKTALLPDREGFEAFHSLVVTVTDARHYPSKQTEKIRALRETLDKLVRHPDIVDARNRIEKAAERLDGLREWVRQSPDRIIELAPGYTAWLRDRAAAIDKWETAKARPDLREQCALLADAGMKAEIDRLKDPARVEAGSAAADPDRVREINAMSEELAVSGEKAATAKHLAEDLRSTSNRAPDLRKWSETSGRPIHEAPGFAEWRAEADDVLKRCDALSGDPELKAHFERADSLGVLTETALPLLRDEQRYRRPVVRQQVRQESEESSISFRM